MHVFFFCRAADILHWTWKRLFKKGLFSASVQHHKQLITQQESLRVCVGVFGLVFSPPGIPKSNLCACSQNQSTLMDFHSVLVSVWWCVCLPCHGLLPVQGVFSAFAICALGLIYLIKFIIWSCFVFVWSFTFYFHWCWTHTWVYSYYAKWGPLQWCRIRADWSETPGCKMVQNCFSLNQSSPPTPTASCFLIGGALEAQPPCPLIVSSCLHPYNQHDGCSATFRKVFCTVMLV